ncbi:DUF4345 domain-containing protein [Niabella drilacis]|uniref:DUF4345 domain-containing protein n=1 Tax=Niabella drilacis (strain DSM 25811 / CCM 8410 / CCUG 62505 / LMG 26954 / E90) TaxID=1285928 RepID=A0A1G6T653_NIADE|nr:DUF4345 domain-containing protein [Niabella drilacis]SDD24354.1 protein of unknown function [Niabella drilacis]
MKKIFSYAGYGFVCISALSLAWVSAMAWYSPQAVMDLVQVTLKNTDALSSIRGVYGGVGFSVIAILLYMTRQQLSHALLFLSLFWLLYALSRLVTIWADGALGAFGSNWLIIETTFGIFALVLYLGNRKRSYTPVS